MSIIRRKKRIILWRAVCGLIFVLFSGAMVIGFFSGIHRKRNDLTSGVKSKKHTELIQLTKNKKAGDVIEDGDIGVLKVSLQEVLPLYQVETDYIGKRLKLSLDKKTILTKEMVYEGKAVPRDLRLHKYQCIKLSDKLQKGDFVDIRIGFANGTDFVLLSKKRIEDIIFGSEGSEAMDSLWIEVTEEEILRMSSAVVDAYQNEGSSIYAISYILDTQESATVNYPVNEEVSQLMVEDPNIIKKGEKELTSRLRAHIGTGKMREEQKPEVIEEQEEYKKREEYITAPDNNKNKIEYFD